MENNNKSPRLLVLLAALMLAGALFLPIWRIELDAPQYPEGLVLKIGANGLTGDVDIVNGLNHYIGMRTLHSEDFIEFTLLPYIIGFLIMFGFVTAFINKKRLYYTYITVFMLFAIGSMVDFYSWEYKYGHNLDPNAPIQVPGMSYQPPLIGFKQLLNFGAFSIPDVGGWVFIGAGLILFITLLIIAKPTWLPFKNTNIAVAIVTSFTLLSCSTGPQPISYGSDACDFCKMTIIDKKFASEWVTGKGKVFRFDDVKCLASFRKNDKSEGTAYVNDFSGTKELNRATELFFAKSEELKTPMGGKVAAFVDKAEADQFLKSNKGVGLSWQEVEKEMKK